jgi:anaerobic ribonucleoside-triphosphate reductase activating protein
MGGEPLCEENALLTFTVIEQVKYYLPDTKIYIWTGYTIEELLNTQNPFIIESLRRADVLIDGPYIEAERDITLSMRGSRNQRILDLKKYF